MNKPSNNEKHRFFLIVFLTLAMTAAGADPAAGESPAIDETAAGKIVVCTDNLRLRTAPSLEAETIALLKEGTEAVVTAVGRPFSTDGIDSRWCRVMTESVREGWCFGGYLSPKEGAWGDVSARKRWESPEGVSVCVSPTGAWALAANISMNGAEGSVYLYRADTGKLEKKYYRRCDLVSKAATFAGADERIFYPTSDAGSPYDWVESALPTDAAGKSDSLGSALREYGHTTLLEASEDGAWLALGFDGNNAPAVAFYNTSQRQWTRIDDREFLFPISFAFSPDSSLCAGSASNRAGTRVWDMRTLKTLWKRDMVAGHVFFSRDGTRLYCVNEDLTVLDAKTGTTVKTVPLGLAAGTVARSIAYTRDRSTLVVSNGTEFAYFFNLPDERLIGVLMLSDKPIIAVSLDAAGKTLGVSSGGPEIKNHATSAYDLSVSRHDRFGVKDSEPGPVFPISEDEKSRNYLLGKIFSNRDKSPSVDLEFDSKGQYRIWNPQLGAVEGAYSLKGNAIRLYPLAATKDSEYSRQELADIISALGIGPAKRGATMTIESDYEDFFVSGAVFDDKTGMKFESNVESPAGKRYEYEGTACVKGYTEGDKKLYLVPLDSLRMRKGPWTRGDPVHLGFQCYDEMHDQILYIRDRTILFKGTVHPIRATSVKKDTIDGITAPWYLVCEGDGDDVEGGQCTWAWVFGGYAKVIGTDKVDEYRAAEKRDLPDTLRATGLVEE